MIDSVQLLLGLVGHPQAPPLLYSDCSVGFCCSAKIITQLVRAWASLFFSFWMMTCQADIIYSANHTCSNFTSYKNTYALQSIPHARSILKWSRWWIAIDDRVSVTKRKWRETCSLPLLFCLGTIGQEINTKFVALNGSYVQKHFCLWVNGYHKENFNTNASCLQANSSMPAHQDKTSWIWPFMKRLNMAGFLFFFLLHHKVL